MSDLLPCFEQTTGSGDPASAVIWMHGLGADGRDFLSIVPHLGLDNVPIRFVFPNAPSIPVTINRGFVMPAWYDIRDGDLAVRHDAEGIRRSATQIEALIDREHRRGVPSKRIVLAGFSQGGAMAYHVGLRYPERLAGIVALSTYLVLEETLAGERSAANAATPILAVHGSMDPMVTLTRGESARDWLTGASYPVEWHTYPMQHEMCLEEVEVIGQFLRRALGS
ncbi:MAG: alpha/beta hydrolase [bacterium]|nr:alpha/beta hydrolase [bacterium]